MCPVRGGAAALLLELMLCKHYMGEGEQLFKSFGLRTDLPLRTPGRDTWRCGRLQVTPLPRPF
jgi:hypothetical protein